MRLCRRAERQWHEPAERNAERRRCCALSGARAQDQGGKDAVLTFPNTTVGSLVQGLAKARVDTRRTISILQALKAAGKKFESKVYSDAPGGHGFGRTDATFGRTSRREVWEFLARHLKPPKAVPTRPL